MLSKLIPICWVLVLSLPGTAQQTPDGFVYETVVAGGLHLPVDFDFLPDGRALIVEKNSGAIQLWAPAAGSGITTIGTVPDIDSLGERGLLSVIADPDFEVNGFIYVWCVRAAAQDAALLRFELAGDLDDPASQDLVLIEASEHRVLTSFSEEDPLHNGGTIRFGANGMLYLSIGDDADRSKAQDTASLKGCVLRLDVSGLPPGPGDSSLEDLDPGDNPFSDAAQPAERLVIAWGLRNPFTFTIDPVTNDLFIGDVGSNTREELNHWIHAPSGVQTARNYGWPFREGSLPFPGAPTTVPTPGNLTEPIAERTHFIDGFAMICGDICRPGVGIYDWGAAYGGSLFTNDYIVGTLRRLERDASSDTWNIAAPVPGQTSPNNWGTGFAGFTRFRYGPDGALYTVDFLGGALGRIRPDTVTVSTTGIFGDGQVGLKGEIFGSPFVFELRDVGGLPIPNQAMQATVSPNAQLIGPSIRFTDALGRVAYPVRATDGGAVNVSAQRVGDSGQVETITSFARALDVQHFVTPTSDLFVVELTNTSLGSAPVPSLIVAASAAASSTATVFGTLVFNPANITGVTVIEDPLGTLGGGEMVGGYGTPSLTNVYFFPTGVAVGQFDFQAVWLDFTTVNSIQGVTSSPIAPSNIVTLTF